MNRSLRFFIVVMLVASVFTSGSSFAQKQDPIQDLARRYMEGYRPPPVPMATETPDQAWQRFFAEKAASKASMKQAARTSAIVSPPSLTQEEMTSKLEAARADLLQKYPKENVTPPPSTLSTAANSIAGYIYSDANGNGTFDTGEQGLSGYNVYAYDYYYGYSYNAVTDANGYYIFPDLYVAYYYYQIYPDYYYGSIPSGFVSQSQPTYPGYYEIAYNGGEVTGMNFGYVPLGPSTFTGVKFHDVDGDGTRDAGESGLEGWVITLTDEGVSYVDTTDALGNYSITATVYGYITIVETPQAGWSQSLPGNDYSYNHTAVGDTLTFNFGNWQPTMRVNMMPSYSTNVTYANALVGTPISVWGNVSYGTAPYRYILEYGDGSVDSGDVSSTRYIPAVSLTYNANHTYATAGTYTARLTVRDATGATDTDEATIKVNAISTKQIRINMAIEKGLVNLYLNQYPEGYWYGSFENVGATGMALLAFEENGHLPTNDFDDDIYSEFVKDGLSYLFNKATTFSISTQTAGNPDSDGDGIGMYLNYDNYANSIGLLGILAAHRSETAAKADTIAVGAYAGQTAHDLLRDALDQYAYSQSEGARGGWQYNINTSDGYSDNSAVQWAALLIEGAQNWGLNIQQFVKDELDIWLAATQDGTGGFGYTSISSWNNIAKTGAGIGSLVAVGYGSSNTRVQSAINFINNTWNYTGDVFGVPEHFNGNMYAMYAVAKGMRILDNRTGVVNIGTHNWYDEYSTHLLDHATWGQQSNGAWSDGYWIGDGALATSMGVLILTQGVVIPPPVAVIAPISNKPPNTSFTVDGSGSYHQDGSKSIVEWLWDWDASNGLNWEAPDASGQVPTNPGYTSAGTYTVTLRVKDNSDPATYDLETANVTISIENNPPVAVAIPSGSGPSYAARVNEPILLDGRGSYDPDAPADAVVSYAWDTDGDGQYDDAFTDTTTVVFTNEYAGQVGLRVTDSHGATSSNVAYVTIVASRKDLFVVNFLATPFTIAPGGTVTLKAIVKNDATSNTDVSSVLVKFYDENPLTTGNQLGGNYFASLPVGVTDTVEAFVTLPLGRPAGTYKFYVYLDANSAVSEWDETNNFSSINDESGPVTASISGYKFEDVNGDGDRDEGEPGLSNWTINLYQDSMIATTTTDGTGLYTFSNLESGSYKVGEVGLEGWLRTFPTSDSGRHSISLEGVNSEMNNFGNFRYGFIGGKKFIDLDGDGLKDVDESFASGWQIVLTGPVTDTVTTDESGSFAFGMLTAGSYQVSEIQQSGWTQTSTTPSPITVTSNTQATGLVFGNFQYGTISGAKFSDLNANGSRDEGEPGLSGWQIVLDGLTDDTVTTDGEGNYVFSNLTAGAYAVSEIQQLGWEQTYPAENGNHSLSITSGMNASGKDFGNSLKNSISGTKYNDVNGNGARDEGEAGLSGWSIVLMPGNDTTTTDGNGAYTFPGLSAGSYTISEVQQSGWTQTAPSEPTSHSVTIEAGQSITGKDFGNFQLGSISGIKFQDNDGDGTRDEGENGLAGWSITLSNDGGTVATTTTGENGSYQFTGVGAGTYTVLEVNQTGWTQTAPETAYEVTINSGTAASGKDFGNFQNGSVSGVKFEDIDGDGQMDEGEPGIMGWTITLDGENNIVTGENGIFSFSNVGPGSHTLTEASNSEWTQTHPSSGSYEFTLTSGQAATGKNFGNFENGTISGVKYNDLNANGSRDDGEALLSGWSIVLSGASGNDTLVTSEGEYSFTNVGPGSYTVTEVGQVGWSQTAPEAGSYTITMTSGLTVGERDFGNFQGGSISGMKFNDLNGNGVKDVDENGLQNWQIVLSGAAVDTALTNSSGAYSFDGLVPGTYTVSEINQSGWSQTTSAPGAIVLTFGQVVTNVNFGNYRLATVSGTKFDDSDGDAVKDESESGLEGWVIKATKGESVKRTVTDGSGAYSFSFNASETGTWTVAESLITGWEQTLPSEGSYSILVQSGTASTGNDFGNFQSGSISGTKYTDNLGDSSVVGDAGLAGWVIKLFKGASLVSSMVTDENGDYSFGSLSAGTYVVQESLKSGWIQTFPLAAGAASPVSDPNAGPRAYELVINSGTQTSDVDFGNFELGTLSGVKFNDMKGDSVKDETDPKLGGWMIHLSHNDVEIDTMSTAPTTGSYSFTGLLPGTYVVNEDVQSGWVNTKPSTASYSFTLESGQDLERDFGNFKLGSISGNKFFDHNMNGEQDELDEMRYNFKIVLTGLVHAPDTVVTDSTGYYEFPGLFYDTYTVSEVAKSGWTRTYPASGSYTVEQVSGLDTDELDFGNFWNEDTTKYFGFSRKNMKAKKAKLGGTSITTITAIIEAYKMGAFPQPEIVLGFPDSISPPRWGSVTVQTAKQSKFISDLKFFNRKPPKLGIPPAGCFTFREKKNATKVGSRWYNHLAMELLPLKVAVFTSNIGLTPGGLEDLIFHDVEDEDNPLNEMSIAEIIARADTTLSIGCDSTQEFFDYLDSTVTRINAALLGTADTVKSQIPFSQAVSMSPLEVVGKTPLYQVSFLRRDPDLVPAKIRRFELPDLSDDGEEIAEAYSLNQNYPNPFNPQTIISFALPVESFVTVKIYNLLGQEMGTLLDRMELESGDQEIEFDGSALPSGVYFYRLHAEPINGEDDVDGVMSGYTSVKKMLLVK